MKWTNRCGQVGQIGTLSISRTFKKHFSTVSL